jgi:hypothetical protein
MPKCFKKLAALSLAACCAIATQPATAIPLIDNGPYFDAGLGYGYVNENTAIGTSKNDALLYGIEGGYFLFHGIGIDLGFYKFPDIDAGGKNVVSENYSGQISVRAGLPMPVLFSSIFCKLGMGYVHTKFGSGSSSFAGESSTAVTGFGAVGIKFSIPVPLTPKLSFEGIGFSSNGDRIPSRYGALATVGWDF